jgi:hypothetical protein
MSNVSMRRLKIHTGIRCRKHNKCTIYPFLRIEGNWLKNAGFDPKNYAYVIIQDGCITIKPDYDINLPLRA